MTSSANNIAVSIVEDDVSLRSIYAGWIEEADGFTLVSQYDDGQEAHEGIPADMPDVVITDINLPGLNGVECVRSLKNKLPQIQFIMITVYEDSNRIFKALEAGATAVLGKPLSIEAFMGTLHRLIPAADGLGEPRPHC